MPVAPLPVGTTTNVSGPALEVTEQTWAGPVALHLSNPGDDRTPHRGWSGALGNRMHQKLFVEPCEATVAETPRFWSDGQKSLCPRLRPAAWGSQGVRAGLHAAS